MTAILLLNMIALYVMCCDVCLVIVWITCVYGTVTMWLVYMSELYVHVYGIFIDVRDTGICHKSVNGVDGRLYVMIHICMVTMNGRGTWMWFFIFDMDRLIYVKVYRYDYYECQRCMNMTSLDNTDRWVYI